MGFMFSISKSPNQFMIYLKRCNQLSYYNMEMSVTSRDFHDVPYFVSNMAKQFLRRKALLLETTSSYHSTRNRGEIRQYPRWGAAPTARQKPRRGNASFPGPGKGQHAAFPIPAPENPICLRNGWRRKRKSGAKLLLRAAGCPGRTAGLNPGSG